MSSYTRYDLDAERMAGRRVTALPPQLWRMAAVAVWSVIHAALLFAEHLAEFLAPLCLLAGGLWWAIPKMLNAVTLDGPPGEMLNLVRSRVPTDIYLDGSYYSAHTLIVDGIWLFGVVAVARTLATALTALLLDRR